MIDLSAWVRDRGYRAACGSPEVLDVVRAEIEGRLKAGAFEDEFYRSNLDGFRYLEGVDLPEVKTIIVVAVPRPAHVLVFQGKGNRWIEAVLPPTYLAYRETTRRVLEELARPLSAEGYRLAPLQAPLKAVAVKLGLVTYGRNNITYVEGFGSYHQLVGASL